MTLKDRRNGASSCAGQAIGRQENSKGTFSPNSPLEMPAVLGEFRHIRGSKRSAPAKIF